MGLDPAPKNVRSPLARRQVLAGQPECDHTSEERCVTTFFHQRPHPPSHVTTFPRAPTGTAALRPHLIFERREPQRVAALPASQRGAVRAAVGPAGEKPP